MLTDVFYFGEKPNVHPREKFAKNYDDAKNKATTRHFWIINEYCDYKGFDWDFDFEFLPDEDVWAEDHINIWPSTHQKDSGTWLCSSDNATPLKIYRADVEPVKRKKIIDDNWKLIDKVDEAKFDFSWHPDPTDPPYIYKWGCKYFPVEFQSVLEYHVPGATQIKYMTDVVELTPDWDKWLIDDDTHTTGFDFNWRPDPREPAQIYQFGTQHQKTGGPRYVTEGAVQIKYLDYPKAKALPRKENFLIFEDIDEDKFDFSWHPDDTSEPYIYAWGNQWNQPEDKISVQYTVPGAVQYTYMHDQVAVRKPSTDNWKVPENIDTTEFDFSWEPNPNEPAYIYEFGTQHQKTGGPRYIVEGADTIKYLDLQKATALPNKDNFIILDNIDEDKFDFSWHPDATSEPYIYAWGNQWNQPEDKTSIQYIVPGAVQYTYMKDQVAIRKSDLTNWEIPENIDTTGFDFSWEPNPNEPAYIYEFGTQHQKTGGPRYTVESATTFKYLDFQLAKALPNKDNFIILDIIDEDKFDFSWHPDNTSEPYIYAWGNQWNQPEDRISIQYIVPGAIQYQYMKDQVTCRLPVMDNWIIPDNIDATEFDFSWEPNPNEPAYIYEFGTQHQKTGGPRYIVEGADKFKYLDFQTVKALSNKDNFIILDIIDEDKFDFSWHPDNTSEPYIYAWGNQWNQPEDKISVQYIVPGAIQYQYMKDQVTCRLPVMDNWKVPDHIDTTGFDFSWEPNPNEPAYTYEFGTQHQKTGGPQFVVEGSQQFKYLDFQKVKALPNKENFIILDNIDEDKFDFSWHPDNTSESYIYAWGNQWNQPEDRISVQYIVPGAIQYQYMKDQVTCRVPDMDNWEVPDNIDTTGFDFSWEPNPNEPAYIYEFGTQHQKTGGPRYIVEGGDQFKYIDIFTVKHLVSMDNWEIPDNIDCTGFDFSWHPDSTEEPYIYEFGTQWQKTGGPKYVVDGASQTKYVEGVTVKILPSKDNWFIPDNLDVSAFDFSWHPDDTSEPFIYEFGTQHQKTGGPRYMVSGGIQFKYVDIQKAIALPNKENFVILEAIDESKFDFSWHPDDTAEPYIYVWGNQWNQPEDKVSVQYVVPGAVQFQYMKDQVTCRLPVMDNWQIPDFIDTTEFDFSWEPNPSEPAYIYEFGTQHQKTGGPRYIVEGAAQYKYMDTTRAVALPNKQNFIILEEIDEDKFDFSWHPDSTAEPYIYAWGNQWNQAEDKVSVQYVVPGAVQFQYMKDQVAVRKPNLDNWLIPDNLNVSNFDFSWEPNPAEPPFIYEFGTQWQKTGGPRYVVESAFKLKYIDLQKAIALPNKQNFVMLEDIDEDKFDFSWHPDATSDPFIYAWGNQWNQPEDKISVQYIVTDVIPGSIRYQYMKDQVAIRKPNLDNWVIPDDVDVSEFDFSWEPNPNEPPFVHQFGTQWQKTGGPRYVVMGASGTKYINGSKAKHLPNKENWEIPSDIREELFDFSWHPDSTEEPYIYEFGTQWQSIGGPKYIANSSETTEKKYIDKSVQVGIVKPDMSKWYIPENIDIASFDFSWHPRYDDPPYIYEFGTQWQKTGGPRYIVGASNQIKYVDPNILCAKALPTTENWDTSGVTLDNFDYSWHPDSTEEPVIYQFGSDEDTKDGPKYIVPSFEKITTTVFLKNVFRKEEDSVQEPKSKIISQYYIETTLEDLINQHPEEIFWAKRKELDYKEFNFDWRPESHQSTYVHVFGPIANELKQTYLVDAGLYLKGYKELNFVDKKREEEIVHQIPNMFFVDKGNKESIVRFDALKRKYPSIQKTRYLNSWVDTINRCINRSLTDLCWILNSELDYTNFDFNYYPNPWQMKMVHIFGTQWNHWGTTFLVNKNTFSQDTKYIKVIEHLSNLNFIKDKTKKAKATECLYDVYVIDFGNKEMFETLRVLQNKVGNRGLNDVEYQGNYLDTFKDILSQLPEKKEQYIWICSSICDYTNFDFTYICDPFAKEQLHVFPSDKQKYGDTFLVNVNKLRELIPDMEKLQDYGKINFNNTLSTKRFSPPVIISGDTHTDSINIDFDFPYAIFVTEDHQDISKPTDATMSLWTNEMVNVNIKSGERKSIIITSNGGTQIIVPKEAKNIVQRELYDYPYIIKSDRLIKSNPLDIVFLSNGEPGADENYEHLLKITNGIGNRIVRVDGVNGRVNAYHAAAEASNTPWMFTVFAKLKVSNKFDWNWQPDRLQVPKHYVFTAKNPLNNLVYGHQAMIAYNKKMTLANQGRGLDFTQDDEHEVLDILSGVANFNTDAWTTWRTSFREALKLCTYPDQVSQDRLKIWTSVAEGDYAQECLNGANDAVEYFDEVAGDYDELKLSYDWAWLREYYNKKYN